MRLDPKVSLQVLAALAAAAGIFMAGWTLSGREGRPQGSHSEKVFGYFGDISAGDRKPYVGVEEVTLKYQSSDLQGIQIVGAESRGKVRLAGDEPLEKGWRYSGFSSNEFLAFSYASGDPKGYGLGVCFLRRSAKAYEGFWVGRDTEYSTIIRAPYVLYTERIDPDRAGQEFPILQTLPEEIRVDQ